ncbi:tetratricopeptide repeat protein [Methanolacinia paynteri]|uniref:tetratricopeptide repeat protein n=1 Tax=Methanolacinia paynteri TaxID=230356 RepID=UPI00064F6A00|nr:tetratricopeptide repeat protein [Methanolacinia paynteri]
MRNKYFSIIKEYFGFTSFILFVLFFFIIILAYLYECDIIFSNFNNDYYKGCWHLNYVHSDFQYLHSLLVTVIEIQVAFISLILSTLIVISQLMGRYQTPSATDAVITDKKVKYTLIFYACFIVIEILALIFIDILNNEDHDFPLLLGSLYLLIIFIISYLFCSFSRLIVYIVQYTNVKKTLDRLTLDLKKTIIPEKTSEKDSDFYIQQILDILSKSILNHESSTFFHGLYQLQKELFDSFCQNKETDANECNNSIEIPNECDNSEFVCLKKKDHCFFFTPFFQDSSKELFRISLNSKVIITYLKSKFTYLKSKFTYLKSKFTYLKSKFTYLKSKFTYLKSKIPFLKGKIQASDVAPIQKEEINSLFIFTLKDCCSMSVESKYERGFIIIIEILTIYAQGIINLERKLKHYNQKHDDPSQKLSEILYSDSIIFLDLAYKNAYSKKLETALVAIGWGFFYFFYQYIDNGKKDFDDILQKLNYYLSDLDQEELYSVYPQYSFILTYFCIILYERSTGIFGDKQEINNFPQKLDEVKTMLERLKYKANGHTGNIEYDLDIINFCIEIIQSIKLEDLNSKGDYRFNNKFISVLSEILRFIRINLGTEYLLYANLLTLQANYYFINGDYFNAEGKLIHAKEIICKKYGKKINYATSVGHLARLYNDWGRLELAKQNCSIATYIRYKEYVLGQKDNEHRLNHKDLAASFSIYGVIFRLDFNNDLALKIMDKALEIRKIVFGGEKNHLYAAGLLYVSFLNMELGNYKLAFCCVDKGSQIRKEIGSLEKFPSLGIICLMLKAMHINEYGEYLKTYSILEMPSDILSEINKIDNKFSVYSDPQSCFRTALKLCDEELKNPEYNICLEYNVYLEYNLHLEDNVYLEDIICFEGRVCFEYNISSDYNINSDYNIHLEENINSDYNIHLEENINSEYNVNLDYLSMLLIKIKVLYNLKRYNEAKKLCLEAEKIKPKGLSDSHPSFILPKQNLTRIHYACGEFETGLKKIEEAFELAENFYKDKNDKDNIYYIASLLNLSNARYIYGLFKNDKECLNKAEEGYIKILKLSMKYGPVNGLHCLYMGAVLNLSRLYLDSKYLDPKNPKKGLDLYNKKLEVNIEEICCPYDKGPLIDKLKNSGRFLRSNKKSVKIKFIDLIELAKENTEQDYLNLCCFYDEIIIQYKEIKKYCNGMKNCDEIKKNDQIIDYSKKYEQLYYYKIKVEILTTDHLPTLNTFFNLATYF